MPTTALPTEAHWAGWVLSTAVLHGWTVHTEYEAERANSGWPSLVMLRGPRMVVAKIKAERGEVTKAQQQWIDQFAEVAGASNGAVSAHVWRPADRDEVLEVLGE